MIGFLRGDADVLVSTSIIESGIDIPQANTLIVDRADTFGLSQLYQIRGRVGRSRERAYAYLLYPSAAALTPEAADRLSALSDYTELGAGFKVAMRDLELRGAGALLGDEQSGHVAALGFELYMQMLDEAVARARARRRARRRPSPCGSTSTSTPTSPPTTSRTSRPRSTCTAASRARATSPSSRSCAPSWPTASATRREPLENLITLQQARIKLGEAGAQAVTFRQGRLAVTPIELDSVRAKRVRDASSRARCTRRASRSSPSACPTTRPSASRPWCAPPTSCWRSSVPRDRFQPAFICQPLPSPEHEEIPVRPGALRLFCAGRRDRRRLWRRPGQRCGRGRRHHHRARATSSTG